MDLGVYASGHGSGLLNLNLAFGALSQRWLLKSSRS